MPIISQNPATGEVMKTFALLETDAIATKVDVAHTAFLSWKTVPIAERIAAVAKIREALSARKEEFARMDALEMGKPVTQGRLEVGLCEGICTYYIDNAERLLSPTRTEQSLIGPATTIYEPAGIIFGVMPWNFPYSQVFRFAIPAIIAGDTVLVKHASNVPQCALLIEEVVNAGLPENVYQNLFISSTQVEQVIADPRVAIVTLTGSNAAGSSVASLAGKYVKKSVMELGGSDPFVVLDDADMDKTITQAVFGRLRNAGQACTCAKRMIVQSGVYEEFVSRLKSEFEKLVMGDPLSDDTFMGPLVSPESRENIEEIVADAVGKGATVVTGGKSVEGPGNFYQPTILTGVKPGMRAYDEEVFGPVAIVYPVDTVDQAVELANDTIYGLSATIWTTDQEKARAIASRIDSGMVGINVLYSSTPSLPFGGVKQSGYGRELGEFGIRELVNVKTVAGM